MSRYSVAVQTLPAQTFVARLGQNTVTIELQWMVRFEVFRVNILTALGVPLTMGRFLLPNVNLLAGLYPPPVISYGSLTLEGDPATPENLGIDNMLVWSDE
ncbi:phage baseplate plug family protein [Pseudomonas sp. SMN5]|uniref:phage baseplate plug family protein n=1 Tax=Pseudomonas sp. SMN5 TaxID=3390198 RepID=UPI003F8731B7